MQEQHSKFWMEDDTDESDFKMKELVKLAGIKRAIANFVTITTGKNIPVVYTNNKDSYASRKNIVISASEDPRKHDIIVGLALHEASHIKYSNYDFLEKIQSVRDAVRDGWAPVWWMNDYQENAMTGGSISTIFHPDLVEWIWQDAAIRSTIGYPGRILFVLNNVHLLMNIMEDRRIDQLTFNAAKGYRPYYTALYNEYFLNSSIGKSLMYDPSWREITAENYINRILLSFHPQADPEALPGLKTLLGMVDIENISRLAPECDSVDSTGVPAWKSSPQFKNMPVLWQVANELLVEILKYVKLAGNDDDDRITSTGDVLPPPIRHDESSDDTKSAGETEDNNTESSEKRSIGSGGRGDATGSSKKENIKSAGESDGENTESDSSDFSPRPVERNPRTGKPGAFNKNRGTKDIKTARDVVMGTLKKKTLSGESIRTVNAIESANADFVEIEIGDAKTDVMVLPKINETIAQESWFPFSFGDIDSNCNATSITIGKRMGRMMHDKLMIRNDPLFTQHTRLSDGKIDRRLLANLGMDIMSVFSKTTVDSYKPALIHLTIDASSSMAQQGKWDKSVSLAVALGYVGSKIPNLDVVISIRSGITFPVIALLYDSRKDTHESFLRVLSRLRPLGYTPEGLAFKSIAGMLSQDAQKYSVYFVNISDGQPYFPGILKTYPLNLEYTRKVVGEIRNMGINILSYFVSNPDTHPTGIREAFSTMYGEDARFIDVQSIPSIIKTLNGKLSVRG